MLLDFRATSLLVQGQFRQAYRGHDNTWLVSGSYARQGQQDVPFSSGMWTGMPVARDVLIILADILPLSQSPPSGMFATRMLIPRKM